LLRYAWAVHELSADPSTVDLPVQRDVCLAAYRDVNDAVRWLELSPLAAAIVERLASGEALGHAVLRACESYAVAPGSALEGIAALLADLGERGVLLGAPVPGRSS
jgi:hypothetical protein